MPQDELWACSARLTGWTAGYAFDVKQQDVDQLTVVPRWSKQPGHARSGSIALEVPSYARWHVGRLLDAAHGELLGGFARNVPGVVQAELRRILCGFQEGELH